MDFGGCRCQAFMYAGDGGATDPVCKLSENRKVIDQYLLLKKDESVVLRTLTHQPEGAL